MFWRFEVTTHEGRVVHVNLRAATLDLAERIARAICEVWGVNNNDIATMTFTVEEK